MWNLSRHLKADRSQIMDCDVVKCSVHEEETPSSKKCNAESSMGVLTAGAARGENMKGGAINRMFSGTTRSSCNPCTTGTPMSFNNQHPCTTSDGKKSQSWQSGNKSQLWQSPVVFKSCFADDCEDIVNLLRSKAVEGKSGSKRKLDVSLIEDEPPPFFSTPLVVQDEVCSTSKRKRMDVCGSKRNLYSYFQFTEMSPYRGFILKRLENSGKKVSFQHKSYENLSKGPDHSVSTYADIGQSWVTLSSRSCKGNMATSYCERSRKKLTPVKEVSLEAKASYEWRNKEEINLTDVLPTFNDHHNEQLTKSDSMFNSMLAAECEDLNKKAKQAGLKFDHKLSLMMEKSSMLEGSLLDLEKMNLDLLDFHLLDESNRSNVMSFSATGDLFPSNLQINMMRNGKCEGIDRVDLDRNSLSNDAAQPVMDKFSMERTSTLSIVPPQNLTKDFEMDVTSDYQDNVTIYTQQNALNSNDPTGDVKATSQSLSDGRSMENHLSSDKMTSLNICEDIVLKSVDLVVANLTRDIVSFPFEMDIANVTHDIALTSRDLATANVTQGILPDSKMANVTQIVSNYETTVADITQEKAAVNIIQETMSNTWENAVCVIKEVNPSKTAVLHFAHNVSNPSEKTVANVLKDLTSCPGEISVVNVTQDAVSNYSEMDIFNVTKDVAKQSGTANVNVHDSVPKLSRPSIAYIRNDLVQKTNGKTVINITHDLVSKNSVSVADVTQDIVLEQSVVAVANATQDIVTNKGTALNGTNSALPTCDEKTGVAGMNINCIGETFSITQDVLTDCKVASNKLMDEVTFSMNGHESVSLSNANPPSTGNKDFLSSCPVLADQITNHTSDHLEATTDNEVNKDRLKQCDAHPKKLETCTKPWDTVLEDSVLSNGSLSFLTSTPVTRFSNYHLIVQSGRPIPHDPNFSFSFVEARTKKDSALKRPSETKLLRRESWVNKGISKDSMLPRITKSNVPVAKGSRVMAPPNVQSLDCGFLYTPQLDQKLTKETAFAQIRPGGNNGRGIVCSSRSRISLPRTTVASIQKNTGEPIRRLVPQKPYGTILQTLVAGDAKLESRNLNSQVPNGTLNKPTQRFAGDCGQYSLGGHNTTTVIKELPTNIATSTACPKTALGSRNDIKDCSCICPSRLPGSQMSNYKGLLRSGLPRLSKKT